MDTTERTEPGPDPRPRDARREILDDLRPVRPLAAPWKRALLWMVPWGIASAALVWMGAGLRPDFAAQGPAAVLGVSIGTLVAACALGWLLARESVPGLRAPLDLALLTVAAVVAARIGTAGVIHAERPLPVEDGQGVRVAFICAAAISALALPCLVAFLVLVRRGLTTRTLLPAILAGTAAAIGSEACWQLHCPFTSPVHLIAGHLSPIIVLAALWLGLALGARRTDSPRGAP